MRTIITIILLLFVYSTVQAQPGTADIRKAVADLNNALLQRDSVMLKKLLYDGLTYGHSNGWIETKREVIDDLYNGKLVYHQIQQQDPVVLIAGKTASVRSDNTTSVTVSGKEMKLELHVLQVWIKTKKGWQLMSRQSVKR